MWDRHRCCLSWRAQNGAIPQNKCRSCSGYSIHSVCIPTISTSETRRWWRSPKWNPLQTQRHHLTKTRAHTHTYLLARKYREHQHIKYDIVCFYIAIKSHFWPECFLLQFNLFLRALASLAGSTSSLAMREWSVVMNFKIHFIHNFELCFYVHSTIRRMRVFSPLYMYINFDIRCETHITFLIHSNSTLA